MTTVQDVGMKGIQNKKSYLGNQLSYTYPVYVIGKENIESFFHARLTRMRQQVSFGELSNDVETTGTGSMHAVASKVACKITWKDTDL
jgi:hypothetical protein